MIIPLKYCKSLYAMIFHALCFCCRVMVLDQGRIVEFKDPNTLLKDKSTVFYAMAKDANIVS